jgi:hypothetical protein
MTSCLRTTEQSLFGRCESKLTTSSRWPNRGGCELPLPDARRPSSECGWPTAGTPSAGYWFESPWVDLSSHNANPPGAFDGESFPLSDLADTKIEEGLTPLEGFSPSSDACQRRRVGLRRRWCPLSEPSGDGSAASARRRLRPGSNPCRSPTTVSSAITRVATSDWLESHRAEAWANERWHPAPP